VSGDVQASRPTTRNWASPSTRASTAELAWENEGGHLRGGNTQHGPGRPTVDELAPRAETGAAPHPLASFRDEVSKKDHDVVDDDFTAIGGRQGGYNNDHESFGYRHSI